MSDCPRSSSREKCIREDEHDGLSPGQYHWSRGKSVTWYTRRAAPIDTPPRDSNDPTSGPDGFLSPRPYVAANLREALKLVADTGDWHGQLQHWCNFHAGDTKPNRTAEQQRADAPSSLTTAALELLVRLRALALEPPTTTTAWQAAVNLLAYDAEDLLKERR